MDSEASLACFDAYFCGQASLCHAHTRNVDECIFQLTLTHLSVLAALKRQLTILWCGNDEDNLLILAALLNAIDRHPERPHDCLTLEEVCESTSKAMIKQLRTV